MGVVSFWFSAVGMLICFSVALCILAYQVYKERRIINKHQEAAALYRAILASSKDFWACCTIDGTNIMMSRAFRTLFDISTGSSSLQDIADHLPPHEAELFLNKIAEMRINNTQFSLRVHPYQHNVDIDLICHTILVRGIEHIIVWASNLSDLASNMSSIQLKMNSLIEEKEMLSKIIDAVHIPIWTRNENLQISFCNKCYADILKRTPEQIIANNTQIVPGTLFGQGASLAATSRKTNKAQTISHNVVIAGKRCLMEITETPISDTTIVGFGVDISEREKAINKLDQIVSSQNDVLESISTAVAIFNEYHRLVYFNSAYRKMMNLDEAWLHSKPTLSDVYNELKVNRMLPECTDFREYKRNEMKIFSSIVTRHEDLLHLLNGRTLRLVRAPYFLGGVLFLYDDITTSLQIERKYNEVIRTQKEVMDSLLDTVMVFGSDNRLKYINNEGRKMLCGSERTMLENKHIAEIIEMQKHKIVKQNNWEDYRTYICSNLTDRLPKYGMIHYKDVALVIAYTPLSDGSHMHIYYDNSNIYSIDNYFRENIYALETLYNSTLEFVEHFVSDHAVTYHIICDYVKLLMQQAAGPLSQKQMEYCSMLLEEMNAFKSKIDELKDNMIICLQYDPKNICEFNIADVVRKVCVFITNQVLNTDVTYTIDIPETVYITGDMVTIKTALYYSIRSIFAQSAHNADCCTLHITMHDEEGNIMIKMICGNVSTDWYTEDDCFSAAQNHLTHNNWLKVLEHILCNIQGSVHIELLDAYSFCLTITISKTYKTDPASQETSQTDDVTKENHNSSLIKMSELHFQNFSEDTKQSCETISQESNDA